MTQPNFTFIPAGTYAATETEEIEDKPGNEDVSQYDFSFIRPSNEPEPEEGYLAAGKRHAARTLARGIETVGGLPGNLREFSKSAGEWLGEKGRQLIGKPPLTEEQKQVIRKEMEPKSWDLLGKFVEAFPTTSEIRQNVTQPLTGDYLEPQNFEEGLSDEVFSDVAALLTPVKGANGKLKVPFLRAIGTALFANTAGEVAKAYGLEPDEAGYTKMGAMLLAGFMGRGGARKYANDLYREAIDMIPQGATTSGKGLLNQVDSYIATLKKGGISPQKQPALSLANQLRQKVIQGGGDIAVEELPAFRRSVNDYRFNRQAGLTDSGKYFLDRFDDILNNELMNYGKQNPAFLKKYRDANTGLAGFKQSNKVADYISKKVDVTQMKPETLLVLGMHAPTPGILGGLTVTAAGAKVAQLMHRIGKNSVLRQYYLNVLENSLKDNAPAMLRNLERFDIELAKDLQNSEEE
jgi:hypothetical protein